MFQFSRRFAFLSTLKDEKLIKKQSYTKTETCKLHSGVFWIFLPNFIKINLHNFELYRFKVGAFFGTQCSSCTAVVVVVAAWVYQMTVQIHSCARWRMWYVQTPAWCWWFFQQTARTAMMPSRSTAVLRIPVRYSVTAS